MRTRVLTNLSRWLFDEQKTTPAWRYAQGLWAELLPWLARPSDWLSLTVDAYDRSATFEDETLNQEIFDWERRVLSSRLPDKPGKVLVAAAGGGREMLALAAMGWQVAGFEPSAALVSLARERVESNRLSGVDRASYEEFARQTLPVEAHAPFDAVILGWGSFSHIADQTTREGVLRKARTLCPDGPIVLSWIGAPEPWNERRKVRKAIESLTGTKQSNADVYDLSLGMIHVFTKEEIEDLAALTDNAVLAIDDSLLEAHAVLGPETRENRQE